MEDELDELRDMTIRMAAPINETHLQRLSAFPHQVIIFCDQATVGLS